MSCSPRSWSAAGIRWWTNSSGARRSRVDRAVRRGPPQSSGRVRRRVDRRPLPRGRPRAARAAAAIRRRPVLELRERELVRRYLIDQIDSSSSKPPRGRRRSSPSGRARRNASACASRTVGCAHCSTTSKTAPPCSDPTGGSCTATGARPRPCVRRRGPARPDHRPDARRARRPRRAGDRPADRRMVSLARGHESFEMNAWGRAKEGRFDAVYRPDGTVGAVALSSATSTTASWPRRGWTC